MHEGDLELIGPRPKRKLGILRQVGHLVHACAWIRAYGDVLRDTGRVHASTCVSISPFKHARLFVYVFYASNIRSAVERLRCRDGGGVRGPQGVAFAFLLVLGSHSVCARDT